MTEKAKTFEFALLFDGKGGARELTEDEVGRWKESDGILWIDMDQNRKRTAQWLTGHSGIKKDVVQILLANETRPRTIVEPEGLVVVMRGINMNPGSVPDDMVAVRMWLEKNRIITSHRRTLLSIGDVRSALEVDHGPKTVGGFLIALTEFLANRIESSIENIEKIVEDVESQVLVGEVGSLRTLLGTVRRQMAAIRRHLAPQRDALDRLARAETDILLHNELYELREAGEHVTRQLEDLDLARENALVNHEELVNRTSQEQNARMYLLSVVAAIFLPLTFVTGLLGMNVAGLPGLENPNGFLYSALIMGAFGIGLAIYFKLKKWI